MPPPVLREWPASAQRGGAIALGLLLASLLVLPAHLAAATGAPPVLLTEPNAGMLPLYRLLGAARSSIDLTMYELADPAAEAVLAGAAARGVAVRVLLDQHDEQAFNTPAYRYLAEHGVAVRWAPGRFDLTHEKAAVIDRRAALVMTLNLTASSYETTRDFAVEDEDPADVTAIETVFAADWAGTVVTAPSATDLVWSPGAEPALVALIDSARHGLLVENEEMDDPFITAPLAAAARRGVHVDVVMTAARAWTGAFDELAASGVAVRTYAPSATPYIHAKVIVADAGYPDARAFVGSENFSIASLVYNRELGILTAAPSVVDGVAATVRGDFAGASPWPSGGRARPAATPPPATPAIPTLYSRAGNLYRAGELCPEADLGRLDNGSDGTIRCVDDAGHGRWVRA